jgi:hypothetical protein
VRQFDFSQLPVYESGQYVGILTTNTIARWLVQQLVDGGEHRNATISEVMEFRELSLDPPANAGRPLPVRFLHEEYSEVIPGVGFLAARLFCGLSGLLASGRGFGWP